MPSLCPISPPSHPPPPFCLPLFPDQVRLPGEQFKDLDLNVTKQKFTVMSAKHRLNMFLPHPVDHDSGEAKWDGAKNLLVVNLPIIRNEW